MGPYQLVGALFGCVVVFALVVAALVVNGVPVLLAFLGVYAAVVVWMLGMQHRARQYCDGLESRWDERSAFDGYPEPIGLRATNDESLSIAGIGR